MTLPPGMATMPRGPRCAWRRPRWHLAPSVLLLAGALHAQGTVSGRVTLTERAGESTSDLANTVIYLVPKGGASRRPAPVKTQIAMSARQFTPRVRVVPVGSTVAFPNDDPFSHNIFSSAPGAAFDLGTYAGGEVRENVFRKAGAFPVYCNIHPRMTAQVLVVGTPWYTQAGADGRWSIEGVPAGRYALTWWHERVGEVAREVEVPVSGLVAGDATLDARGYVSKPHLNKFGKSYTASGKDRY